LIRAGASPSQRGGARPESNSSSKNYNAEMDNAMAFSSVKSPAPYNDRMGHLMNNGENFTNRELDDDFGPATGSRMNGELDAVEMRVNSPGPLPMGQRDDPFQFEKGGSEPETPLDLLGRTVEGPFGLKQGQGVVLVGQQASKFLDWVRAGDKPGSRSNAAKKWLDGLHVEMKFLAELLAREGGQSMQATMDVLSAGLLSHDKQIVAKTLRALCALANALGPEALPAANDWLAAPGGPTVALTTLLCDAGGTVNTSNIRVGDAKAVAEAARAAARDAMPNYAENPEEVAGARFALGYHGQEDGSDEWVMRAQIAAAIAEIVERICGEGLHHFLLEDLRNGADARTNPRRFVDALNVLIPALLARGAGPRNAIAGADTPGAILLEALRCAEGPVELRESALTLLTTLWSAFPDEIEVIGDDCRKAVAVLKKTARDPQPATQIHALACMFQLLHAFINSGNAYSPVVYKTIVFMFIEHVRNNPVRDFISAELKVALDSHANIPVGILVDPVVKQSAQGGSHPGLKRVDFALIASMAEHARLEARPALHLLNMCLTTALDHVDPDGRALKHLTQERAIALKAATRLAARLKGEDAAEETIERAAGAAMSRLMMGGRSTDGSRTEEQRAAGETIAACATAMAKVAGPGVLHLKDILRSGGASYASKLGHHSKDIDNALTILQKAMRNSSDEEYLASRSSPQRGGEDAYEEDEGEDGEYGARKHPRAAPLPLESPDDSPGGSDGMDPHQRESMRMIQRMEHMNVGGRPTPGPPPLASEYFADTPTAFGDAQPKRVGFEGISRAGGALAAQGRYARENPTPVTRPGPARAPSGPKTRLHGEDYRNMPKGERLRLQREEREREIHAIAVKNREKQIAKEMEMEAKLAKEAKLEARIKKKRLELAAAARASGRTDAFDSLSSPNRMGGMQGASPAASAALLGEAAQAQVRKTLNARLAKDSDCDLPPGYERVNDGGHFFCRLTQEALAEADEWRVQNGGEALSSEKRTLSPAETAGMMSRLTKSQTFLQRKKEAEKEALEAKKAEELAAIKRKEAKINAHNAKVKAEMEQIKAKKAETEREEKAKKKAALEKKRAKAAEKAAEEAREREEKKSQLAAYEAKKKQELAEKMRAEKAKAVADREARQRAAEEVMRKRQGLPPKEAEAKKAMTKAEKKRAEAQKKKELQIKKMQLNKSPTMKMPEPKAPVPKARGGKAATPSAPAPAAKGGTATAKSPKKAAPIKPVLSKKGK